MHWKWFSHKKKQKVSVPVLPRSLTFPIFKIWHTAQSRRRNDACQISSQSVNHGVLTPQKSQFPIACCIPLEQCTHSDWFTAGWRHNVLENSRRKWAVCAETAAEWLWMSDGPLAKLLVRKYKNNSAITSSVSLIFWVPNNRFATILSRTHLYNSTTGHPTSRQIRFSTWPEVYGCKIIPSVPSPEFR